MPAGAALPPYPTDSSQFLRNFLCNAHRPQHAPRRQRHFLDPAAYRIGHGVSDGLHRADDRPLADLLGAERDQTDQSSRR